MSYDGDDFYCEPNEFEQMVDKFKQSLLDSVKEEFKAEMNRLREENAELQQVKRNWADIKAEHQREILRLQYAKNEAAREARKERLGVLMEDFKVAMFQVKVKYIRPDKCDKCNENRLITYKTPLGKDAVEKCTCNTTKSIFVPEELICVRLHLDNRENKLTVYYNLPTDDEDGMKYGFNTPLNMIYDSNMEFAKLDRYGTFFNTVEDCQAYCDWLNGREGES
ncbi:hypothetical protein [Paenibacillus sp. 481]|uniref:hypothetical protein n=1 Tax=Paenibacillus sp. 481 TaxID=2835869 RepID=UPI001E609CC6|nr:hypothetical protein [Paenibacillus sp. 481]UHA74427.1 hypothetical protein KIK04_04785 [Paenibacillus sp. 481]